MPAPNDKPSPEPAKAPPAAEVIDAARLFGSAKEVQIELQGVRYRLRITRRGKLILQK
jgi:hemin uptake protein HemP